MGYSHKDSTVNNDKRTLLNVLFVILCLITVIVVVYIKVQNFDFVGYDDELYVTQNQYVQKGISLEGIKWAFTTFHSANWHPLTWLSHMLDCELYGLNPAGHHWTSVTFHIANTILLFLVLFTMTRALWKSALVAALFALHPLHVESVAWVSERKDVLSTFFGLLSIAAYCRYVRKSSTIYYIWVSVFLSLGLMVKPMLVTIPFVLLLIDFWPLKRFQFQRNFHLKSEKLKGFAIKRNYGIILEKIPFFILVIISCIVTFFAQKSEGALKAISALPMQYRIENAIVSYVKYLLKTIWPHKLAVFYPHPENMLPSWQIFGAAFLIIATCFCALRLAKQYPYVLIGLFWYLGTLVPVIGLVQVGNQAMADRYTYIPLIGIFIIISWSIADLFKERRFKNISLGISAAILLVALSGITYNQLSTWKNGITLFEHTISVTENNYHAHNNLGTAYEPFELDKAILHYKKALKINQNFETALYNLGNVFFKKGNNDEAIHHYLKALHIKPDYTAALNNLGEAFAKKGDFDRAIYYFKRASITDPKTADARINLASVLYLKGNHDEAISRYIKILQTESENADLHYNLAYVLYTQGKIDEAVFHFNETLRIDPNYSKAHYCLGNILSSQGRIRESILHYAKTIKSNPNDARAYNKLGSILFRQGKLSKAKLFYLKALQINPNYSEARHNLDIVQKTSLSR